MSQYIQLAWPLYITFCQSCYRLCIRNGNPQVQICFADCSGSLGHSITRFPVIGLHVSWLMTSPEWNVCNQSCVFYCLQSLARAANDCLSLVPTCVACMDIGHHPMLTIAIYTTRLDDCVDAQR